VRLDFIFNAHTNLQPKQYSLSQCFHRDITHANITTPAPPAGHAPPPFCLKYLLVKGIMSTTPALIV
jgi:hypothetical protein